MAHGHRSGSHGWAGNGRYDCPRPSMIRTAPSPRSTTNSTATRRRSTHRMGPHPMWAGRTGALTRRSPCGTPIRCGPGEPIRFSRPTSLDFGPISMRALAELHGKRKASRGHWIITAHRSLLTSYFLSLRDAEPASTLTSIAPAGAEESMVRLLLMDPASVLEFTV